jgi:hypothetical protein
MAGRMGMGRPRGLESRLSCSRERARHNRKFSGPITLPPFPCYTISSYTLLYISGRHMHWGSGLGLRPSSRYGPNRRGAGQDYRCYRHCLVRVRRLFQIRFTIVDVTPHEQTLGGKDQDENFMENTALEARGSSCLCIIFIFFQSSSEEDTAALRLSVRYYSSSCGVKGQSTVDVRHVR